MFKEPIIVSNDILEDLAFQALYSNVFRSFKKTKLMKKLILIFLKMKIIKKFLYLI